MYRLILVRFDRDTGRFEDEEFNKFCAEQSIVRIEKEFINTGGEIYYSFFIEYVSRKVSRGKTSTDDLSELELAQTCLIRNKLIIELADRIVVGYASPDGEISKLLMSTSKPFELLDLLPKPQM